MDVNELIDNLRMPSWHDLEDPNATLLADAADALSTLQAENEKLRAELEQVKWERDAAVSDLETIMAYNSDTCQFCKNGQCYVRGGTKSCLPKWRGQKEE